MFKMSEIMFDTFEMIELLKMFEIMFEMYEIMFEMFEIVFEILK